jgi:hypothetical protein
MALCWPAHLRTLTLPCTGRAAGGARTWSDFSMQPAVTTNRRMLPSRGRDRQLRITTCDTDHAPRDFAPPGLLKYGPAMFL